MDLKETDEIMKQNIIFHHLSFVDQLVVVLMRFGSVYPMAIVITAPAAFSNFRNLFQRLMKNKGKIIIIYTKRIINIGLNARKKV